MIYLKRRINKHSIKQRIKYILKYDELLDEANDLNLRVHESVMPIPYLKGLYVDGNIIIDKNIDSRTEKTCVLAEEIGHSIYTVGDILDQDNISNMKQEKLARSWAYEELVPIHRFIDAYKENIRNRYELADFLDVTEKFIDETIKYYLNKYGPIIELDHYLIYLSPLGILKRF